MKLEDAGTLGVLPAGSVCQLGVFAMCLALYRLALGYVAGSEIECSAELNNKNLSFLSLLQVVTNITIYVVVQVQDFQLRGKRGLTEKEPKCAKQKWYLFSVCFGKKVDMQGHTFI